MKLGKQTTLGLALRLAFASSLIASAHAQVVPGASYAAGQGAVAVPGGTAIGPGARAYGSDGGPVAGGTAVGNGATVTGDGLPSTALGAGATAGANSLAISAQPSGQGSAAAWAGGVGIYGNAGYLDPTGQGNNNGIQSIAIQGNAGTVAGAANGAIAIGAGSSSNALSTSNPRDFGGVSIGVLAQSTGVNSVALGAQASAGYSGSLAIGQGATITAPTGNDGMTTGAVAIGQGARANADPGTALGYQSNAAGANSVALGAGAVASGSNSVALGAGSVANRANSVSVGSATQARQITNVAPGTMGTDAVNLNQLRAATSGLLAQASQHADEVAAMSAAVSMTPQFGPKGYALTAAVAGVGSQSAVGIGFARAFHFHQYPAYWQASIGFNGGSGTAAVKIGGSIGW